MNMHILKGKTQKINCIKNEIPSSHRESKNILLI